VEKLSERAPDGDPAVITDRGTMAEPLTREQTRKVYFDNLYVHAKGHIRQHLGSNPSVLDFGAGSLGYIELYAEELGGPAYALDVNDYSASYKPPVTFIQSDGATIPLSDGAVDLVVSHSVLEHVDDVGAVLREMNRIVRRGGLFYLTVSPLYFSPRGMHNSTLPPWEHLRPGSDYFRTTSPFLSGGRRSGANLNQLTLAQLMAEVLQLPWQILTFETKVLDVEVPDWLEDSDVPLIDLITREFRLVARKFPVRP
jgi:SAM-dependent methyltransferase